MNEVLRLESVSKKYGTRTALKDYSLSVEKGHICGIAGHNGAGKTTIMNIISGHTSYDSGKLIFFGGKASHVQAQQRIGFAPEKPAVSPDMTVYDNLTYMRYLKGVPEREKTSDILSVTGLSDLSLQKVKKLSYEMKKRLGFAMTLTGDPEIVILDEPFSEVDTEGAQELKNIIRKLSEEKKITFIISAHRISEIAELCTDFSLVKNGELSENLRSEELMMKCRTHISLKTDNIDNTASLLEDSLDIKDYQVISNEEIQIFSNYNQIHKISKTITDSGIVITGLAFVRETPDDYYLSKAGEK